MLLAPARGNNVETIPLVNIETSVFIAIFWYLWYEKNSIDLNICGLGKVYLKHKPMIFPCHIWTPTMHFGRFKGNRWSTILTVCNGQNTMIFLGNMLVFDGLFTMTIGWNPMSKPWLPVKMFPNRSTKSLVHELGSSSRARPTKTVQKKIRVFNSSRTP